MEKRSAETNLAVDFRIRIMKNMISVAMATYNGERYIAEQLESICKQTKKVDEVVIVDDCSTDGTTEIVRKYRQQYPQCNIRVFENEANLGYKKNFYRAMSLCEGDIIFLCDQDDIWKADKVETLVKILENYENAWLVSSSFIQIDGDGKVVSDNKSAYQRKLRHEEIVSVPLEDLIFHNISQGCAMAFRKEVRNLYLENFAEELPHDWMINVIAAMRKKCYYLNRPMFYYRIHDENTIGLNEGLTLSKKNSLAVRTHDAMQAVKVINLIEKMDCDVYYENMWLKEMWSFAMNHISYLENKESLKIMFQNFNPYYKKLKTVRGRLLDMFFCVKK